MSTYNQQKNKFKRAANFFYFCIFLVMNPLPYFFPVVLHDQNVKLPETSLLHVLQRKCYMRFCSLFFNAADLHLGGRQHFSFSHRRFKIFIFLFQQNWSPLQFFFISRSTSLSVIHVNLGPVYTDYYRLLQGNISLKISEKTEVTKHMFTIRRRVHTVSGQLGICSLNALKCVYVGFFKV